MTGTLALGVDLALVGASVAALWAGARLLVENATRLARRAGLSDLVVGLTVVGFGTSTPELATSIDAALAGAGDVAVANVVGSNLFNVGVVLGVVSLRTAVPASRAMIRRDGTFMVVVAGLAAVVVRDAYVGRWEGALLVALLAGYVAWLLVLGEKADPGRIDLLGAGVDVATSAWRPAVLAALGLAVVLAGADVLVGSATDVARLAGVSEWVVGETVVAAGTSSPEIAASVVAARRGATDLAAGNVVGSNVFNVLGVLGTAALVRPLAVSPVAFDATVWLVGLSAFVVVLLATRGRLTRPEGLVAIAATVGRWVLDAL